VPLTNGVVLARTAGGYRVHTDAGEITASLRGKLKRKDDDRVVPGDVVELEDRRSPQSGHVGRCWRDARRRAAAARAAARAAGRGQRRSGDRRDLRPRSGAEPRMIDRFLVIAEANGLPAAIVLNKIELDRTIEETLARRFKTAAISCWRRPSKRTKPSCTARPVARPALGLHRCVRRGQIEPAQRARAGPQAARRRDQ